MENKELKEQINTLKKEKDAVILAHYYVDGEVQKIADYVGDSFYLSKAATKLEQKCKTVKSGKNSCDGR